MITEKRFAELHHAFWTELLPMAEHFVRTTNLGLARYCQALHTATPAHFHGVINELGFRLFTLANERSCSPGSFEKLELEEQLSEAMQFISSFRQHGRGQLDRPGESGVRDSVELAERTLEFFRNAAPGQLLVTRPPFRGCGWVSECEGDVLANRVLYEVKAGDRKFRTIDIKQVLTYCALSFAAKEQTIEQVCLLNPRTGLYLSEPVEALCQGLSGRSAAEVLGEIVEYLSEPGMQYSSG